MRPSPRRSRWIAALCVGLASASFAACKPTKTTVPPESGDGAAATPATDDERDPVPSTDPPETRKDEPPLCGDQGTAWDGSHSGCVYEHAGCCYPDPAALCVAAGCPDDTCQIIESRPAQATCG